MLHNPMDAEVADGWTGMAMNLCPEDGVNRPVKEMKARTWLPEGVERMWLHRGAKYANYLFSDGETLYWTNREEYEKQWPAGGDVPVTSEMQEVTKTGDGFTDVAIIGKVLSVVGSDKTEYFRYIGERGNERYEKVDVSNIYYKVDVNIHHGKIVGMTKKESKDNKVTNETLLGMMLEPVVAQSGDITSLRVKPGGLKDFWTGHVDAWFNQKLAADGVRYLSKIQFGVAAVRLWDGSHVGFSQIFCVCPMEKDNYNQPMTEAGRNDARFMDLYCYMYCNSKNEVTGLRWFKSDAVFQASVNITMPDTDGSLEDVVSGVDIYLTPPRDFLDMDSEFVLTGLKKSVDDENDGAYCINIAPGRMKDTQLNEEIDSMLFYHSAFVAKKDFGKSATDREAWTSLERISQGELPDIQMTDIQQSVYGAKVAVAYNGRLHLANYTKRQVTDTTGNMHEVQWGKNRQDDTDRGVYAFGQLLSDGITEKYADMVCVYVEKKDGNEYRKYTVSKDVQLPLPPLLSVYSGDAKYVDVYIRVKDTLSSGSAVCYHTRKELHKNEVNGFNYYVMARSKDGDDVRVGGIQGNVYCPAYVPLLFMDPGNAACGFARVNEDEYTNAYNEATYGGREGETYPNEVKVSGVNNMMTFDAVDSISAGSGEILAMKAAARQMSEGQFGQYPLYIFTTDGVWAAEVGATGTYVRTHPISEDVINDGGRTLSVDGCVLFTTSRGVMMATGSNVECISDVLDGPMRWTRLPYVDTLLEKAGMEIRSKDFVPFRVFLKGCAMVYDYYNQRVIVYNEAYSYAYIYSLKSRQWGMMPSRIRGVTNEYPSEDVITEETVKTEEGEDVKNLAVTDLRGGYGYGVEDDGEEIPFVMLTRPMKWGEQEVMKTVKCICVRGDLDRDDVCTALWGSRDGRAWRLVWSSRTKWLRGFSGTPYKQYVVGVIGRIDDTKSLSGLSVEWRERMTNRMR